MSILAILPMLAALAAGQRTPGPGDPILRAGKDLSSNLEHATSLRSCRFEPDAPGPWTLRLSSLDFDASLELFDAGGSPLARDADSGPGSDAWLVVELRGTEPLWVLVVSADGQAGEFTLRAEPGRFPAPPEGADPAAEEAWCEQAAERAQARARIARASTLRSTSALSRFRRGDLAGSQQQWELVLELSDASAAPAERGLALAHLGAIHRRRGSLVEATQCLEDALEAGGDSWPVLHAAFALDELGETHAAARRAMQALECFDRLVELARAQIGGALVPYARSKLARTYAEIDERTLAQEHLQQALVELRGERESDRYYAAETFLQAGLLYSELAQPAEARASLEDCLAFAPEFAWRTRADAQVLLARLELEAGRFVDARSRFLELCRVNAGRDLEVQEPALSSALASLAAQLREDAQAEERIAGLLAAEGAPGLGLAQVDALTTLGFLCDQRGDFARAGQALSDAAQRLERLGPAAGERTWRVFCNLGTVQRKAGDSEAAVVSFRRALESARAIEDELGRACALANLAYDSWLRGDAATAQAAASDAAAVLVASARPVAALAPLHTLACLTLDRGDFARAEELLVEARETLSRLGSGGLSILELAGFRSQFALWSELAQDLVAARLEEAQDRPELRADLAGQGLRWAAEWKSRALLEGLAGDGLESDSAATAPVGSSASLIEYAEGGERLFAYAVSTRGITRVDLGPLSVIRPLVERYAEALARGPEEIDPEQACRSGLELADLLVAPVLAVLPGEILTLVIAPTATLASLPFEALVLARADPEAGEAPFARAEFLADRYQIALVPSGAVLARLCARAPRAGPTRALLLGDPLYATELAPEALRAASGPAHSAWKRIPGTRREVLGVARALLVSAGGTHAEARSGLDRLEFERSGSLSAPAFELRLGSAASAQALLAGTGGCSLLHVAAHGWVDAQDPRRTTLVLSQDDGRGGLVALADILELELEADLVVLSACETARGRNLRGEGVQSLAQAFFAAGARSVIASLWRVGDLETEKLMQSFYRALLVDGATPLAALSAAKRELRSSPGDRGASIGGSPSGRGEAFSHPHYWAAFVYSGPVP